MASLFRPRRSEDERGAGGKLRRGRRASPSCVSPYARPPPLPSPPPAQFQSPKWFLGLISGAGKLISSVFRSDSDESSQSSSSYTAESSADGSDDDDDTEMAFKECGELNQRRNKTELVKDGMEDSLAIVPKSDAKIAIEQLLMQETFSRNECDKLTKIIQSRVVEFEPTEIDDAGRPRSLPDSSIGRSTAFTGAWQSVNYFTSDCDALSPGSPLQVWTPVLHDKAVMEAKKYLEEKKLGSSSKYDQDCGPCILNTDMLHYDIQGEGGSPVDMAKSYMQSLPPWQSPSLSSTGFKTPPLRAKQLYKDGATKYSLSSSKVPKRNHLAIGSHDDLDETRRSHLKSTDNILEFSKFKQVDPSANLSAHRNQKFSSASHKKESLVEDHCGSLVCNGQKAVEANRATGMGKITSNDNVTEPEEADQARTHTQETLVIATNSLEPTTEKGNESKLSAADMLILEKDERYERYPPQMKEQGGSIPNPYGSLVQYSRSLKHDGDHLSEANVIPREEAKSMEPSDCYDAINHISSIPIGKRGLLQYKKSSCLNKEGCSTNEPMLPGGQEANGSINRITENRSSVEVNTNLHPSSLSKGETDAQNFYDSELASGNAEGSCELLSEATINVSASHEINNLRDKLQNGTRMTSIGCMLAGPQPRPQPNMARQGRKRVVKSRRGRGKLK